MSTHVEHWREAKRRLADEWSDPMILRDLMVHRDHGGYQVTIRSAGGADAAVLTPSTLESAIACVSVFMGTLIDWGEAGQ